MVTGLMIIRTGKDEGRIMFTVVLYLLKLLLQLSQAGLQAPLLRQCCSKHGLFRVQLSLQVLQPGLGSCCLRVPPVVAGGRGMGHSERVWH